MKKTIAVFIAFAAALLLGIAAIVVGACGENGVFGGFTDISELTRENVEEGMTVKGLVYGIWDKYAVHEKDENGEKKVISESYTMVMPYSYDEESPVFIGISSGDSAELSSLEQMRSETEGILTDSSDGEYRTSMVFRGKLRKLDEGELSFLKVSVSTLMGVTEEDAEEYIVPYVIESDKYSPFMFVLIAGIVLTVIGFGGVLVMILKDIGEGD